MRLVTRSDFDGLVCAVLLEEAGIIEDYYYCHPKDLQDGIIEVTENDVLANVPYVEGCGLWFDHHTSNIAHAPKDFKGAAYPSPSAARVIWEYYGGEEKFGPKFNDLMRDVDKVDSAVLTKEDILNPGGWIMLGFIMDPRTGLGRYHHFEISNHQLMQKMVSLIRHKDLDAIYEDSDVYARLSFYFEHVSECIDLIHEHSHYENNTVIIDYRSITEIPVGNRFLIYGLYPDANASIQIGWGKERQNIAISVGKSILNRSNKVDIGALMREYGGGGHENVGTCQVRADQVQQVVADIIAKMNS